MNTTDLYIKDLCCGCGVCSVSCPQNAITMVADENGFVSPIIEQTKCVDCGLCIRACSYRKEEKNVERIQKCFAASNIDESAVKQSASGGVFSAIAKAFLLDGGSVCGAAIFFVEGKATVQHIMIEKLEDLCKLQGSKYVQSNMWECIPDMKKALRTGKKVLFSGTPCQVDAIRSAFKKYLEEQLFTIDIICHGVPNQSFLNDYLSQLQDNMPHNLVDYQFRSKKYGWGLEGLATYDDGKEEKVSVRDSAYYQYFLDGETYRDNCYTCPYACCERVGDITIGDYWGIEKYDSQLLAENGGCFSIKLGVSCLMINRTNGKNLIDKYGSSLQTATVDINNVMIVNTQLREPAKYSKERNVIFDLWKSKGYDAVDEYYRRKLFLKDLRVRCTSLIPKSLKVRIKRLLGMNTTN